MRKLLLVLLPVFILGYLWFNQDGAHLGLSRYQIYVSGGTVLDNRSNTSDEVTVSITETKITNEGRFFFVNIKNNSTETVEEVETYIKKSFPTVTGRSVIVIPVDFKGEIKPGEEKTFGFNDKLPEAKDIDLTDQYNIEIVEVDFD